LKRIFAKIEKSQEMQGMTTTQAPDSDFIGQLCVALDQTASCDNQMRQSAEQHLAQAQQQQGCLQALMQIIMSPGEVAKIPGANGGALSAHEVCLRAVSLLKNTINNSWSMPAGPAGEAANQNQVGNPTMTAQISKEDKDFIKANIFDSLAIAT